ncbi:hypothetical protein KC318_g1948 [Hortaea werneckii]|nr:hypothetical protein KC334_g6563 [Hortaea werneckii]KAI7019030.1 hypothetical protein KC355_g3160 [Hortaea werneckii]KAI7202190.1 hypothetical protein KC324_g1857 [Hortaea werneckii]KAI7593050.1 hypothetical protein KC316_g1966 [Hortaea werneckii]KAI7673894.1 hypothetical protein KC318_g1948 [Hortaea werneckii]
MAAAVTSSLAGAATSALAGSSSSATSSVASSTSAVPSATSAGSSDNGLSGGQIAGIVVGCVVGGLLLIGIGLFCCCRSFLKKRKAKKHQAQLDEQSIMEKTKEPIHSETNPNYSGTGTQQGRPEQYVQRELDHPPASQQHQVQQPAQQPIQQQQPTTPQLERGNPVTENPHGLSGPYNQGGEQSYDAPHTANRVFGAPGQTMSELRQPQMQTHSSAAAAEHQLGTTGYLPTTSTGGMVEGVPGHMASSGRAADMGEAGRTMYRDGQGLASASGNMGKRYGVANPDASY